MYWYSMTRDVRETKGEAAAWSMGRESRAETRERAERELRKREERAAKTEEEEAAAGNERERGGLTGGIKKKKQRRRAKGAASHIQRQVAARRERSEHARQLSPALPPRGV